MFDRHNQEEEEEEDHNQLYYQSKAASEKNITVMNIGDTPIDVFLQSFRSSGSEFISSAYLIQRSVETSTIDGSLYTSLAEDIFTLVETQISLLDEYLEASDLHKTDTGNAVIIDALLNIFRILFVKQTHYRDSFFSNVDSCVAAANDFLRMSDKTERLINVLQRRYYYLSWNTSTTKEKLSEWDITTGMVEEASSSLIDLFQKDAVLASQRSAMCIVRAVQWSSIPNQLFSIEWEDEMTHNEVAKSIIRIYNDYLSNLRHLLSADYLYHKVATALVRLTVCFYVQCFVLKADKARRYMNRPGRSNKKNKHAFSSPQRAVMRMTHDVDVFQEFFVDIARDNATLKKVAINELSTLKVILLECMSYATGQNGSDSLSEFIVVVHKRTGADANITRYFLSDIYVLLGSKNQYIAVENKVRNMKPDLDKMTERVEEKRLAGVGDVSNDGAETSFRLDKMLLALYEDKILQERLSLCGNFIADAKELGKKKKNHKIEEVLSDDESEGSSKEEKRKLKWHKHFDQLKRMIDDILIY